MGFLSALWVIVLGVLGASSLIISKRPDAKQYIDKLAPYQGWMGAVSAVWGVVGIVGSLLSIGSSHSTIYWVTSLATSLVLFCLGLLLGVGVLKSFIKQPDAVEKMDQLIVRLAPKQGALGIAAIAIGVWNLLARIL